MTIISRSKLFDILQTLSTIFQHYCTKNPTLLKKKKGKKKSHLLSIFIVCSPLLSINYFSLELGFGFDPNDNFSLLNKRILVIFTKN